MRLELEIAPDLGPHELHPPDLELAQPASLASAAWTCARDLLGGVSSARGSRMRYSRGSPNSWMTLSPSLMRRRAPAGSSVDATRLLEAHLDQGAAGEVDAVAQAALDQPGAEADQR